MNGSAKEGTTMAEQKHPDSSKTDTTDYSASRAPENRPSVESRATSGDRRLIPGGAMGSPAEVGMSGMDREQVPSKALRPDELDMTHGAEDLLAGDAESER
jgi:hypothetical protein